MSVEIKILVVDDKKNNQLLFERYLRQPDWIVISVSSGDEAIQAVIQDDFALILMDIVMPGKNGFETAEQIRRNNEKSHIPIIFVTAYKNEESCEFKGYEAGAVDFLYKPLDPVILRSKVNVFAELYRREKVLQLTTVELGNTMESLKKEIIMRKAAQERVLKSEKKYRSLFDTSRDGIAFEKLSGGLETANKAYTDMMGYSVEELQDIKNFRAIKAQMPSDINHEILDQMTEKGYCDEVETKYTRKDNDTFPALFRSWVIKDEDGYPLRKLNLVRDITEQRKIENRLRQAQKMEAVGTLAGGIAHDFNNVLAAIMGYIELAQFDVPEESKARKSLGHVLKASLRAKKLVSHILAFSRQSGNEKRPLLIRHIAKEAIDLLRATLPSTIDIRQNIPSKLSTIHADATQLHQILMNLGTNAYHAIGDETGVIEIAMSDFNTDEKLVLDFAELDPGEYIRLSVKDNGCGMDSSTLSKIFDPYFTTKDKGVGTGMGLSVVHGIVKSHGGSINVVSKPGAGSEFSLFFPAINAVEESQAAVVNIKEGSGEQVLFVDDEDVLVSLGKDVLGKLGYKVVAETSSVKALELYKENPEKFDIIVSDTTMPDLTGIQLARSVREINSDIPIILCTGYSRQIDEQVLGDLGVEYLLIKPYEVSELAVIMRTLLEKGGNIKACHHG